MAQLERDRPAQAGQELGLLPVIEADLRRQTAAAQQGDAGAMAASGERSALLLDALAGALLGQDGEQLAARDPAALQRELLRLRDLATYNQLLLRYSFTGWAAGCLEQQRRAVAYDGRGQRVHEGALRPVKNSMNLGVL